MPAQPFIRHNTSKGNRPRVEMRCVLTGFTGVDLWLVPGKNRALDLPTPIFLASRLQTGVRLMGGTVCWDEYTNLPYIMN